MNAANIPSKYEFEHVYSELLKRLSRQIGAPGFVDIVQAMNDNRYTAVTKLLNGAMCSSVGMIHHQVVESIANSLRYIDGGTVELDPDFRATEVEEMSDKVLARAKLLEDWCTAERQFGGAVIVQQALEEFHVTFDATSLSSARVNP
jgi:hypothetical protein